MKFMHIKQILKKYKITLDYLLKVWYNTFVTNKVIKINKKQNN